MDGFKGLTQDQPATYRILVQGRLTEAWSGWFNGFEIAIEVPEGRPAQTTLTGTVADQAELFGLLTRIRDVGLPLVRVEWID